MTEIDHAANAAGAGLTLNPTRLIIFGNPLVGTPFKQADQRIGIDLTQKILVVEDSEGRVFIAINRINWRPDIARHYGTRGSYGSRHQRATRRGCNEVNLFDCLMHYGYPAKDGLCCVVC